MIEHQRAGTEKGVPHLSGGDAGRGVRPPGGGKAGNERDQPQAERDLRDGDDVVEILHTIGGRSGTDPGCLDEDIKKEIRLIASFDQDEIGSGMTTNHRPARSDGKDAMNELVRQAEENDNMTTLLWWTRQTAFRRSLKI
ncbi:MAG: hypothetical protein ACLTXT_05110 [Ruminococcus callidus]